MWQYNHTDELYHYGVKGMRWGHRRFQNKDGSLKTAGKKRYGGDAKVSTDGSAKRAYEEAKKKRKNAWNVKAEADVNYDEAFYDYNSLTGKVNKRDPKSDKNLAKVAKESAKADRNYAAAKAAEKAAKKMAKAEAKEVKKLYRKSYLEGQSVVGKIFSMYTGVAREAADYAYKQNKGAYNKNYKWD